MASSSSQEGCMAGRAERSCYCCGCTHARLRVGWLRAKDSYLFASRVPLDSPQPEHALERTRALDGRRGPILLCLPVAHAPGMGPSGASLRRLRDPACQRFVIAGPQCGPPLAQFEKQRVEFDGFVADANAARERLAALFIRGS